MIEVLPVGAFASTKGPDGRAIYNFRCYFCHGYSGNAKTVASSFLIPPPADFTRASPNDLTVSKIEEALRHGRPGTAMKSFASIIDEAEIKAVAAFVHDEFVVRKAVNTRYHTPENGWPDHQRHAAAFPFATGEIGLDQPWESLTPEQARGRRLFMETCITCHDRGTKDHQDIAWDSRPVSFPRNNFSFTVPPTPDMLASASPYAMHDVRPRAKGLSRSERRGEKLFQANCAFCHAADGTGKNWIGSFLEPHPRNLRDPAIMSGMSRQRFIQAVGEGLANTSMPAWKQVLKSGEISDIADYVSRVFHPLSKSQGKAVGTQD
ncbi:MAG: c-type cytochrome [Rhodocyclales bacterium]|nr:c-type cytochrome [Rhodocyclales bacterium]